ncbi:MAG: FeoC-like transcriptional regulator [Legionellaceae bacterium]|nr:FeoC-like transcriptional regulator [Legionellaceae bacterium]
MLLQLRDYIQKSKLVSLEQLAREFKSDSLAIQPMLEIWINKGLVEKQETPLSCGSSCSGCNIKTPVYYHWVIN